MKSKLEVYALAVCFAAIVCLVISLSIAGYSIVRIAYPEITIKSYDYKMYRTNDSYWASRYFPGGGVPTRPPEEEITRQRLSAYHTVIYGERREALQTLIQTFMFVVVGTITLLLHWRLAKKAARTEKA
jgi:hypothetical protein